MSFGNDDDEVCFDYVVGRVLIKRCLPKKIEPNWLTDVKSKAILFDDIDQKSVD